ncbi:hypothetical protein BGZ76_009286 [Entomortierella beljakovae]|nr:hypothetical protein BGZ76_009286 [Entomortierella beljakovae]
MDKIRYYQPQDQSQADRNFEEIDPSELSYSLEIVQQPQRARMCGFGDKDRRNITPAPVLKLVAKTVDGRIVPSRQTFVVNADLWLEDELTEVSMISVSTVSTVSSDKQPDDLTSSVSEGASSLQLNRDSILGEVKLEKHEEAMMVISSLNDFSENSLHDAETENSCKRDLRKEEQRDKKSDETEWNGTTAQNLVGQTTVGGQVAPDLDEKEPCIWFALSALSVRTEGIFKLRFSLFDLARVNE